MAESVKYAQTGSTGTFANRIGWIDYGSDFTVSSGETKSVVNTISGGYTIRFDVTYSITPFVLEDVLQAYTPPVFGFRTIPFGNTAYTGINGNVVLYMPNATQSGIDTVSVVRISNFRITDSSHNRITNYVVVAADAETTNKGEIWEGVTDGGPWLLIDVMPSSTGTLEYEPNVMGIGTSIVTEVGLPEINLPEVSAPVYITSAPRNMTFTFTTNASREAVALGVILYENKTTSEDSCSCTCCSCPGKSSPSPSLESKKHPKRQGAGCTQTGKEVSR